MLHTVLRIHPAAFFPNYLLFEQTGTDISEKKKKIRRNKKKDLQQKEKIPKGSSDPSSMKQRTSRGVLSRNNDHLSSSAPADEVKEEEKEAEEFDDLGNEEDVIISDDDDDDDDDDLDEEIEIEEGEEEQSEGKEENNNEAVAAAEAAGKEEEEDEDEDDDPSSSSPSSSYPPQWCNSPAYEFGLKYMRRQRITKEWSDRLPRRIRQYIEQHLEKLTASSSAKQPIALQIYRDLVVRIPPRPRPRPRRRRPLPPTHRDIGRPSRRPVEPSSGRGPATCDDDDNDPAAAVEEEEKEEDEDVREEGQERREEDEEEEEEEELMVLRSLCDPFGEWDSLGRLRRDGSTTSGKGGASSMLPTPSVSPSASLGHGVVSPRHSSLSNAISSTPSSNPQHQPPNPTAKTNRNTKLSHPTTPSSSASTSSTEEPSPTFTEAAQQPRLPTLSVKQVLQQQKRVTPAPPPECPHCHVVRFRHGVDGLRFFFAINGLPLNEDQNVDGGEGDSSSAYMEQEGDCEDDDHRDSMNERDSSSSVSPSSPSSPLLFSLLPTSLSMASFSSAASFSSSFEEEEEAEDAVSTGAGGGRGEYRALSDGDDGASRSAGLGAGAVALEGGPLMEEQAAARPHRRRRRRQRRRRRPAPLFVAVDFFRTIYAGPNSILEPPARVQLAQRCASRLPPPHGVLRAPGATAAAVGRLRNAMWWGSPAPAPAVAGRDPTTATSRRGMGAATTPQPQAAPVTAVAAATATTFGGRGAAGECTPQPVSIAAFSHSSIAGEGGATSSGVNNKHRRSGSSVIDGRDDLARLLAFRPGERKADPGQPLEEEPLSPTTSSSSSSSPFDSLGDQLAAMLATHAAECSRIMPLVLGDVDDAEEAARVRGRGRARRPSLVTWGQFCTASNLLAFLHHMPLQRTARRAISHFSAALLVLQCVRFDPDRLMCAVDTAPSCKALLRECVVQAQKKQNEDQREKDVEKDGDMPTGTEQVGQSGRGGETGKDEGNISNKRIKDKNSGEQEKQQADEKDVLPSSSACRSSRHVVVGAAVPPASSSTFYSSAAPVRNHLISSPTSTSASDYCLSLLNDIDFTSSGGGSSGNMGMGGSGGTGAAAAGLGLGLGGPSPSNSSSNSIINPSASVSPSSSLPKTFDRTLMNKMIESSRRSSLSSTPAAAAATSVVTTTATDVSLSSLSLSSLPFGFQSAIPETGNKRQQQLLSAVSKNIGSGKKINSSSGSSSNSNNNSKVPFFLRQSKSSQVLRWLYDTFAQHPTSIFLSVFALIGSSVWCIFIIPDNERGK